MREAFFVFSGRHPTARVFLGMAKLELFGSYVALVTPFTDADEVDYACIEQLVEWHVKEGTAVRKRRAA